MIDDFGWSRGQYFFAFTVGGLVGSIGMLLAGMAADKFGGRLSLLVGITLYAATGVCFGFIGPTFAEYFILWIIVVLLAMSTAAPIYVKIVSRWMDRNRGLAVAIVMVGMGIGNMIIPALTADVFIPDASAEGVFSLGDHIVRRALSKGGGSISQQVRGGKTA